MGKIIVRETQRYNFRGPGGDGARAFYLDLEAESGVKAFRQGAMSVNFERPAAEADATWDGNPDTAGLFQATNRATGNTASEGALRGIQVMARNRGTNINWILGQNLGSRNDSGGIAVQVKGMDIRAENYGTLSGELVGLDVNLSDESAANSHARFGIRIRNTDQSSQSAADAAMDISHTSDNGFECLVEANAATGDGFVASTATPSGAATHALIVRIAGTLGYVPVYAAVGFGG